MPSFDLQTTIFTLGLAINAYFLKQLVNNIASVDKGLIVLITKHERTEGDVKKNERKTEIQAKDISKLRDNVHEMKSDITNLALSLQLSCTKLQNKELIKPKRTKSHE